MQNKTPKSLALETVRRVLLTTTLLVSCNGLHGLGAIAASPTPGTIIQNKATGSFIDTDNTEKTIQSNIVQVTVGEVAGITIDPKGVTGTVATGQLVYFSFEITNVGNDPTQFRLPDAPSGVNGGTYTGSIQIMSYDADGLGPGTSIDLSSNNITVPNGGATTGALLGSLSNASALNNGSIPPGGTIIVRVPITVTATGGQSVALTLGDTDNAADTQNQVYQLGTTNQDLYTSDNPGTTNGDTNGAPINGDLVNHRQEASLTQSAIVDPSIMGTVFEDVNYGGGLGRNLTTSGGIPRPGVTVELYRKTGGVFITSTTTDSSGKYSFPVTPGDYWVRVVNNTVSSSRGGGCATPINLLTCTQIPIQTFRTDAPLGIINDATNRVGGEKPNEVDAPAQTGVQTLANLNAISGKEVQSATPINVGLTNANGVDFGFNFDTIVNTNNTEQGSLRQFIINSNALNNAGLNQVGQTAGKEVSIFMISDGITHNGLRAGLTNLLPSGVAVINVTTALPIITDANTSIDGKTQTQNVGNTNSGVLGTAINIGVNNTPLTPVNKPEVELTDGGGTVGIGLEILGDDTTIRGMSIWGFGSSTFATTSTQIAIGTANSVSATPLRPLIEQNILGTKATGFSLTNSPGFGTAANNGGGINIRSSSDAIVRNNLVGFNAGTGILLYGNNTNPTINENEVRSNGNNLDRDGIGLELGVKNTTVTNNLIINNAANGVSVDNNGANSQLLIDNNTIQNNGRLGSETAGIASLNASLSKDTISRNIITQNQGAGIWLETTTNTTKITQNSIFQNAGLGIDLKGGDTGSGNQTVLSTTVTANDGAGSASVANNGIDYPIITSSTVSGGTLTVIGFVGSNSAGSANFADATLEFFIADDDGNNNGAVIVGDGKNLSHGEGKIYLPPDGSCKTDISSKFTCTFSNLPAQFTTAKNITATATDLNGNTSEFSSTAVNNPNVLLVKRITAIKLKGTSSFTSNNSYIDDPAYAYDDNTPTVPAPATPSDPPEDTDKWPDPTLYLQGLIDGGAVKPGDEVEFTIYFLSAGVTPAKSIALCDVLPKNMTFVADSFNGSAPTDTGSLGGENLGVAIANNATTLPSAPTTYLTNIGGDDQAQFIPPGTVPPAVCKDPSNSSLGLTATTNTTGAIYLQLRNDLPPATAQGAPTNSYGFIRFRARVN